MRSQLFLSVLLTLVTLSTCAFAQPDFSVQARELDKVAVKQAVSMARSLPSAQLAVNVLEKEQILPLWNNAKGAGNKEQIALVVPTNVDTVTLQFYLNQNELTSTVIHTISTDGYPICHYPKGNVENAHTLFVGRAAIKAHLSQHGDTLGPCEGGEHAKGVEATYIDVSAGFVLRYLLLPNAKIKGQEAALWQGAGSLQEMSTPVPTNTDSLKKFLEDNPVPDLPEPLEPELGSQGWLSTLGPNECGAQGEECAISDPTPPPDQTPPNPFEPIPGDDSGAPEEDTCDEEKLGDLRDDRDDAQGELIDADFVKDTARDAADKVYKEVVDLRFLLTDIYQDLDSVNEDIEDALDDLNAVLSDGNTNAGEIGWDCIGGLDLMACWRENFQNKGLNQEAKEINQKIDDLQKRADELTKDYTQVAGELGRKNAEYENLKAVYEEAKRVYNEKREAYNTANQKYQNYKDKNCD